MTGHSVLTPEARISLCESGALALRKTETIMTKLLLVGLGGFLGSVGRYLVAGWLQDASRWPWFPLGTLGVNTIGCLLIGILGGLAESLSAFKPETRLFLMVGILGGFTTFSTFGYETMALARDREFLAAGANVMLQVGLGLIAVWIGYGIATLRG